VEIGKYFTSLPNLGIFIFYYLMWGQKIFGEMKTIFDLIYSGHPKCNEKEGGKVIVFSIVFFFLPLAVGHTIELALK